MKKSDKIRVMTYNPDYHSSNMGGFGIPSLSRSPWTKRFIIACVVLFCVQLLTFLVFREDYITALFAIDPFQTFPFQFYRLFTYGFLHSPYDVFHILFNLLAIFFFAPSLERLWGPRGFILFCTISLVFSGFVCYLIYPVMVIGASGLVYAVLTAYGLKWPNNIVLFFIFPMRAKYLVMIMLGLETFNILRGAITNPDNVAHFGHLGGAFVALMVIRVIPRIRVRMAEIKQSGAAGFAASDDQQADALFKKIGEQGISSLTTSEREFLDGYSKRKRGY